MASDAFFHFQMLRDGCGIRCHAVVQPGGSVNDEAVIRAANDLGMAMVLTGGGISIIDSAHLNKSPSVQDICRHHDSCAQRGTLVAILHLDFD